VKVTSQQELSEINPQPIRLINEVVRAAMVAPPVSIIVSATAAWYRTVRTADPPTGAFVTGPFRGGRKDDQGRSAQARLVGSRVDDDAQGEKPAFPLTARSGPGLGVDQHSDLTIRARKSSALRLQRTRPREFLA
jgi:hypothetical protein